MENKPYTHIPRATDQSNLSFITSGNAPESFRIHVTL